MKKFPKSKAKQEQKVGRKTEENQNLGPGGLTTQQLNLKKKKRTWMTEHFLEPKDMYFGMKGTQSQSNEKDKTKTSSIIVKLHYIWNQEESINSQKIKQFTQKGSATS